LENTIISEITVKQNDCPHIETSQIFKKLYILIMHTSFDGSRQTMFSFFYSPSEEKLDEALRYFSSRPQIKNFTVISKQGAMANLFYTSDATSMYNKLGNIGFRIHPVVVHNGVEKWFYISNGSPLKAEAINDENTTVLSIQSISQKKFISDYPSIFYQLNLMNIINRLSETESTILLTAMDNGYFEWPRRINMSELSKKLQIPKSTLSYHFRSIERKTFNVLLASDYSFMNTEKKL
jgi:predicted DNA binding protein